MTRYFIKKVCENIETGFYHKTIRFFNLMEEQEKKVYYFENFDSYYDLVTIVSGVEYVTIPMPILIKILWNKKFNQEDKEIKKLIYKLKTTGNINLLSRNPDYDEFVEEMMKMKYSELSKENKKDEMRSRLKNHLDSNVVEEVISELDKNEKFQDYKFWRNNEIETVKNSHDFSEKLMLNDDEYGIVLYGKCAFGYYDTQSADFDIEKTVVILKEDNYYDERTFDIIIYKPVKGGCKNMKLSIVDYNRGQCPSTVEEGLSICSIYTRVEIEEYLKQNEGCIHKVNAGGYIFGFCEEAYKEENQKRLDQR